MPILARASRWPSCSTLARTGVTPTTGDGATTASPPWGGRRTVVDGLVICFLHARSSRTDAFPLILTHGWPGSVVEFLDALEPLIRAGFDSVMPSLASSVFPRPAGRPVSRPA